MAVWEEGLEHPLLHFLEAEAHDCLINASPHQVGTQVDSRGPSASIVVDVVNGDASHAKLVCGPLSAGRVAIDIPSNH